MDFLIVFYREFFAVKAKKIVRLQSIGESEIETEAVSVELCRSDDSVATNFIEFNLRLKIKKEPEKTIKNRL